jgi:hypothetical protein
MAITPAKVMPDLRHIHLPGKGMQAWPVIASQPARERALLGTAVRHVRASNMPLLLPGGKTYTRNFGVSTAFSYKCPDVLETFSTTHTDDSLHFPQRIAQKRKEEQRHKS